jgi:hypothetical protein
MNKDDALRRIKACLARARCDGASENEAETALRQARALMEKYGVDEGDVAAADVCTHETAINSFGLPPVWGMNLAGLVGRFFQCRPIWVHGADWRKVKTCVEYHGIGVRAEIAAYAFQVLYRQLLRDRLAYLKTIPKRIKRANRTARADAFAEAWVNAVWMKVRQFAGELPEEVTNAIEAFLTNKGTKLQRVEKDGALGKKGVRGINEAAWAGHAAGQDAELNHGVGQAGGPALLTK